MDYNLHTNFAQVPIACQRCGAIDAPALGSGARPHAASARCSRFPRWLSPQTPEERQAQLAYLQVLGDAGPVPGSMLEASRRIDALKREGVRA